MTEPLERYRFFKQLSDLNDKISRLLDQQIVLLNTINQLIAQGPGYLVPTAPAPFTPEYRVSRVLTILSAPVDLVDSQKLTIRPDNIYRYDLTLSDILTIISLDDNIYFAPREFTSPDKGTVPLPAGVMLVLRRPKSWQHLWLQSETAETRVYVTEWRYVEE